MRNEVDSLSVFPNEKDLQFKFKTTVLIDIVKSTEFLIGRDGSDATLKSVRLHLILEELCNISLDNFVKNDIRVQYTGDGFYLFLDVNDPMEAVNLCLRIINYTQEQGIKIRAAFTNGYLTTLVESKLHSKYLGITNYLLSRLCDNADEDEICFDNRVSMHILPIKHSIERKYHVTIEKVENPKMKGFNQLDPPISVYKIKKKREEESKPGPLGDSPTFVF